jgi:lambda family phage portal protein
MLNWLTSKFRAGRTAKTPRPQAPWRVVRARFDSAQTTPDNRRHWAAADGLSPNSAIRPEVRRILRNRARYEVANNAYARGIVLTLANDTIGTGPRLQMLTEDPAVNRQVEEAFGQWALAMGLADKLRTMRMARADSGEMFGVLTRNPLLATAVKLDWQIFEAEQVATPPDEPGALGPNAVDGIVVDAHGNPVEYHVLNVHPGETSVYISPEFRRLPAQTVIHYFRADRPGQRRGIPDITPALPLFAQLRRYTLAVIAAAETAADFAAVLYTDSPANGEADPVEPMDTVDLERRMATVLPGGWKLGQVAAEQPATTYSEFKKEILNEIARCLNMPFNVAAGNSSGYNYASGRLDHQTYFKSIRVEQAAIEITVLDRLLAAWLREAVLIEGFLPQSLRSLNAATPHRWFWDGQEHVDPAKEASAQATRLANNTTTLADEYARKGQDWEVQLRQRAKEVALMNQLGLPPAVAQPATPNAPQNPTPAPTGENTDVEELDEEPLGNE